MLKDELQRLKQRALKMLSEAEVPDDLKDIRIKFLGKKGELTRALKSLRDLDPAQRPQMGSLVNEVKAHIEKIIAEKAGGIEKRLKQIRLEEEFLDVTIPSKVNLGHRHPLTSVADEIREIFVGLGYKIVEGPEIETDYYNFEALNTPLNHPARDMQDTFYFTEDILLRTQTSPVQVRVMEKTLPPLKIIAPGRVYRSDAVDATHSPMFHQVEGLCVGTEITMADLKGTLEVFVQTMFGESRQSRFRPHFFPFTEPSAELDISCMACDGRGCRVCSNTGWLEILGCGMVHPNVLKNAGYDPDEFVGFAFGMGVERIAMLKYGINDLRLFYENDLRFLKQF